MTGVYVVVVVLVVVIVTFSPHVVQGPVGSSCKSQELGPRFG